MPTVLRVGAFRVLILFPPREHSPPHVHVVNADGVAVIYLAGHGRPQRTDRIEGMKSPDVRKAERIVRENAAWLLEKWGAIHGNQD
jgi:hypothetical protein